MHSPQLAETPLQFRTRSAQRMWLTRSGQRRRDCGCKGQIKALGRGTIARRLEPINSLIYDHANPPRQATFSATILINQGRSKNAGKAWRTHLTHGSTEAGANNTLAWGKASNSPRLKKHKQSDPHHNLIRITDAAPPLRIPCESNKDSQLDTQRHAHRPPSDRNQHILER